MVRTVPSRSVSLPPPVGGWDTRDALADMPPTHAVVLDNWFPGTDRVAIRPGYTAHATGLGSAVETLLPYSPANGSPRLFAAAGTVIREVTTAGAAGSAVVTGLSNARLQSVQMGTAGGQFLFCCNGADTPRLFDGSTWANTTITGPTVANLAWCNIHQRRMWFGEKNSLTAWYLPVNTIGGAAAQFPMAGLASLGGSIAGMAVWSRDSYGQGMQELACFVTTEGEMIIYAGTDPASASTWGLLGVWRLGRPIGARFFQKVTSDLILLTQDGLLAASTIMPTDRAQTERVALSAQINKAVNAAVRTSGGMFGWQPFIYPRGTMLILNVPETATTAIQFAWNTITNAPCRFVGIPAVTWAMCGEEPYFGGLDGVVYRFDAEQSDNGSAIDADALQAFNYLGSPGQKKACKLIECLFDANTDPGAAIEVATDFDTTLGATLPAPSVASATTAKWGSSKWDASRWSIALRVWRGWRGARGVGRAIAPRVRVSKKGAAVAWTATNLTFIPGGQL